MPTKPADLVLTPLRMAAWSRGQQGHPVTRGDLIAHSGAGSQYTALRYTEHLALGGIAASIGTVGDAYDCEDVGCPGRALTPAYDWPSVPWR